MDTQKNFNDEVEKTLASFDGDPVLPGNPYLATRVLAEWNQRKKLRSPAVSRYVSLRGLALILLLVINVATMIVRLDREHRSELRAQLVSELKAELQIDQTQNSNQ